MEHTVISIKNTSRKITDVTLKLEKYNRYLSRNLKTLEYISMLEMNYGKEHKMAHFGELSKFKNNIQKHVIKTVKKINYYKSMQNKLKPYGI
ncbi:hypothetical protein Q4Q35_14485 [Flavivirga aquimarina]|uniref:Uncharacterized protein n=1 Tax=Flavivirga aquimarina TaxID=2027862 RepID=A0ABT8WCY4_9FLAO|nr:hypothetical protein [Flavivirga aquimarina]MDO5971012.1 hypothetical protein [Flavivirga aquimarina]